jgi:hypothetical protein
MQENMSCEMDLDNGWLSVGLHCVCVNLDRYQIPFKGTTRTPSIMSERQYIATHKLLLLIHRPLTH